MGTIPPNGPDLHENNPSHARYTALSELENNLLLKGLISGAMTISGTGFAEYDPKQRRHQLNEIRPGDICFINNRKGVVKSLYQDSGNTIAVTVLEDFNGVFPVDWIGELDDYGLTEDGKFRQVIYILKGGLPTDKVISLQAGKGESDFQIIDLTATKELGLDSMIIFKKPNQDPASWNSIADAIQRAGFGATPEQYVGTFNLKIGTSEPPQEEGSNYEAGDTVELSLLNFGNSVPTTDFTIDDVDSILESETDNTTHYEYNIKSSASPGKHVIKFKIGNDVVAEITVVINGFILKSDVDGTVDNGDTVKLFLVNQDGTLISTDDYTIVDSNTLFSAPPTADPNKENYVGTVDSQSDGDFTIKAQIDIIDVSQITITYASSVAP